jgi:hypothetical protein
LPIRATSFDTCLVAAPPFMDFGPIRYDCEPIPRATYISNQCGTPVTVTDIWQGESTSRQFRVMAPPLPVTLAPGQGFELTATYSRTVLGQHYSPVFIKAASESVALMVPMLAETNHEGLEIERFTQGTDNQLDVLFVVGNTTTMRPYQDRLAAAIPGWIAQAQSQGVDLRVGVTTSGLVTRPGACGGPAQGGEAGRLVPVDSSRARRVSSTSASAASQIQANINVGACHSLSQPLETMRQALSSPLIDSADDPRTTVANDGNLGFLRTQARLAIVVVTDEDDHSGFSPESYAQFVQSVKGPGMSQRSSLYAIVPTDASCATAGPTASRIIAVAQQTGGSRTSICRSDYGGLLAQIAQRAAGLQRDFHLVATPTAEADIRVSVSGRRVYPPAWRFDVSDNAIIFDPASVPNPGQRIDVRYRAMCRMPPTVP